MEVVIIEMNNKYKILILSVATVICISIIFIVSNGGLYHDEWNQYKKNVLREYSFIDSISLSGNSPSLLITYKLSQKVEFNEVETLFIEARDVLLNDKVFQQLDKIHYRKFGGTISTISLSFIQNSDYNSGYYVFSSGVELKESSKGIKEFLGWSVKSDGITKQYEK